MKNDLNVSTVGIVGCGLIGMSWAAYYLAKGFAVRATDPVAGAEAKLRAYIDSAWPLLEEMGLGVQKSGGCGASWCPYCSKIETKRLTGLNELKALKKRKD